MSKSNNRIVIGIDLGTTNSCIAYFDNASGRVEIIPSPEGFRTIPSIVQYKGNEKIVGHTAKRTSILNAANTIYESKRLMGMSFRSYEEVKSSQKLSYDVASGSNGDAYIKVEGKSFSPVQVAADLLSAFKKYASDFLGQEVTDAVITVPAYFNDIQRQATKDAGEIAGLKVLRIINEPTAAALAYGLDKKEKLNVAIYDFGGGTFDISILEISDGVFEVKSTNGDVFLGGADIDMVLMQYVSDNFKREHNIDLLADRGTRQRLKDACEKAKIDLSSTVSTNISIPFIVQDKHMDIQLSRAKFEDLIRPTIQKTIAPCEKAISDSGLSVSQIDQVVLVGGSTRIPAVRKIVEDLFKKAPNMNVNPDEVVAMGAALQGAVLAGDVKDVLLLDVTPLSLGIEVQGDLMKVMIPANSTIPTKKSEVFTTAQDGQPAVTIVVYQGERKRASQNKLLGKFDLTGIPSAPRGVPQIEVTLDIDANGILSVSAKDKNTNKENSIKISSRSGLSDDEINNMKKAQEENAANDEHYEKIVELSNSSESIIYSTKKTLDEQKDKIEEGIKTEIQTKMDELKNKIPVGYEAIMACNYDSLKAAYDDFNNSTQKIYESMNKNTSQSEPQEEAK